MSHQLIKAAAAGRVVVENKTSGEVMVILIPSAGEQKSVIIPPYAQVELAPKYVEPRLISRSPNIEALCGRALRVIKTW